MNELEFGFKGFVATVLMFAFLLAVVAFGNILFAILF